MESKKKTDSHQNVFHPQFDKCYNESHKILFYYDKNKAVFIALHQITQ